MTSHTDEFGRRFCFLIVSTQDPKEHGGYVPSVVYENSNGHHPMTGDPNKMQTPWVWGSTLQAAQDQADAMNERLGLNDDDVARIIASSMRKMSKRGS